MSSQNYLFASASVTEGRPDKLANQIFDTRLDKFLCGYLNARVAVVG
jgi:S-adenosylmethionine synthetase